MTTTKTCIQLWVYPEDLEEIEQRVVAVPGFPKSRSAYLCALIHRHVTNEKPLPAELVQAERRGRARS